MHDVAKPSVVQKKEKPCILPRVWSFGGLNEAVARTESPIYFGGAYYLPQLCEATPFGITSASLKTAGEVKLLL